MRVMRLPIVLLCVFMSVGCGCSRSSQVQTSDAQPVTTPVSESSGDNSTGRFNPSVVIVSYDPSVGKTALTSAAERVGGKIVYDYVNFNMLAIEKPDSMAMPRAVEYFSSVDGVINAVPDQMCELDGGSAEAL